MLLSSQTNDSCDDGAGEELLGVAACCPLLGTARDDALRGWFDWLRFSLDASPAFAAALLGRRVLDPAPPTVPTKVWRLPAELACTQAEHTTRTGQLDAHR